MIDNHIGVISYPTGEIIKYMRSNKKEIGKCQTLLLKPRIISLKIPTMQWTFDKYSEASNKEHTNKLIRN